MESGLIQYGARGAQVRQLQSALVAVGYSIDVDGIFGPKTRAAVLSFQETSGLSVDGIVGPHTKAKLFARIGPHATTGVPPAPVAYKTSVAAKVAGSGSIQLPKKFIDGVAAQESEMKEGWKESEEKWYPDKSCEGGTKTIGYGHKMLKGETFPKGLTDSEARNLLIRELSDAYKDAMQVYDAIYGKGAFESCSEPARLVATDLAFNTGKANFKKYLKYMAAMRDGNIMALKQESASYYKKPSGEKVLMKRRSQFRRDVIDGKFSGPPGSAS